MDEPQKIPQLCLDETGVFGGGVFRRMFETLEQLQALAAAIDLALIHVSIADAAIEVREAAAT
jgi:hypothetical protein